jgi:hypothetical protein
VGGLNLTKLNRIDCQACDAERSYIPVEQPSELKLMINMRAARLLKTTIAESVRLRAQIIQY